MERYIYIISIWKMLILFLQVIFSIDTGNGNLQRLESNLPSKYMICDNKWHNLTALYDNDQLSLGIDNFSYQTSSNIIILENIQARVNLYIGGLPGKYIHFSIGISYKNSLFHRFLFHGNSSRKRQFQGMYKKLDH